MLKVECKQGYEYCYDGVIEVRAIPGTATTAPLLEIEYGEDHTAIVPDWKRVEWND